MNTTNNEFTKDKFNIFLDGKIVTGNDTLPLADSGVMIKCQFPVHDGVLMMAPDKTPQYLLVIDMTDNERINYDKGELTFRGKRHLFSISRVGSMNFVMDKRGIHKLVFLILSDEITDDGVDCLLSQNKYNYNNGITKSALLYGSWNLTEHVIGYREVEVEVPQTALAEVPKTGVAAFLYEWVNRGLKKPYDECEYERRIIYIGIPKLVMELVLFGFRFPIALICVVLSILIKTAHLIFGMYHSHFIYDEMKYLLNSWKRRGFNIFFSSDIEKKSIGYRDFNTMDLFGKRRKLWISPFVLFVLIVSIQALFKISELYDKYGIFLTITLPSVFIIGIVWMVLASAKATSWPGMLWKFMGDKPSKIDIFSDDRRNSIMFLILSFVLLPSIAYYCFRMIQAIFNWFAGLTQEITQTATQVYEKSDPINMTPVYWTCTAVLITTVFLLRKSILNLIKKLFRLGINEGDLKKREEKKNAQREQKRLNRETQLVMEQERRRENNKSFVYNHLSKKEVVEGKDVIAQTWFDEFTALINFRLFKLKRTSCKPYAKS